MLRIISINLNGIRAATKKGFFAWLAEQHADFVCLQELKAQATDMTREMLNPPGLYGYFHYAEKKGYSGVGIYTRTQPLQVIEGLGNPDFDREGRYLELIYDQYAIVSVYLPSGSSGEPRQNIKFAFMKYFYQHLMRLMQCGRQVILCGDWNIAHHEIDLKNWRGNRKNSGFLPEERSWLTEVLTQLKWCDVYRKLHPDATADAYTWWSNRGQAWAKNVGWRIDYQIATAAVAASAKTATIYKDQRFSDHAPLIIDYGTPLTAS
jgi:exodeoxyribonuclease-3